MILFSSVFVFTRTVFIKSLNLTQTGQIGDTFGGITAPIINLIGSLLIYISFKQQLKANEILSKDILRQSKERNFQLALDLFRDIKNQYNQLNYVDSKGQAAINHFINDFMELKTIDEKKIFQSKPTFGDFKYIICEYQVLLHLLLNSNIENIEQNYLLRLAQRFYAVLLQYPIKGFYVVIKANSNEEEEFALILENIMDAHLKISKIIKKHTI